MASAHESFIMANALIAPAGAFAQETNHSQPLIRTRRVLPVLALFGLACAGGALPAVAAPCDLPQSHEFDFWAGDWDVFDVKSASQSVAHVRIDPILGGCVLREEYEDPTGLQGQSFSTYDPTRGRWHQSWVTNRGQLLTLEGALQGKTMTLNGVDRTSEGTERRVHVTWEPTPNGVRETAIRSVDGGKSWIPWFDLIFRPRKIHNLEDSTIVAALDTRYQAAVKANDADAMDSILADDFTLVVGSGKRFTKADLLDEARSGRIRYEHQEDTDRSVRVWAGTAIVTAKLHESGIAEGKPFDKILWFSDTYVRTTSGWKYVFGQASLALP
jgi:ketosteroid isomerase-like protein